MKSKTFNNKTKGTEGEKHEAEEEGAEKEIQQTHLVQIDVINKDNFSETTQSHIMAQKCAMNAQLLSNPQTHGPTV